MEQEKKLTPIKLDAIGDILVGISNSSKPKEDRQPEQQPAPAATPSSNEDSQPPAAAQKSQSEPQKMESGTTAAESTNTAVAQSTTRKGPWDLGWLFDKCRSKGFYIHSFPATDAEHFDVDQSLTVESVIIRSIDSELVQYVLGVDSSDEAPDLDGQFDIVFLFGESDSQSEGGFYALRADVEISTTLQLNVRYEFFTSGLPSLTGTVVESGLSYRSCRLAVVRDTRSQNPFIGLVVDRFVDLMQRGEQEVKKMKDSRWVVSPSLVYDDVIINDYIDSLLSSNAKAAIMSRNMSHNLGSHVFSYLQDRLRRYDINNAPSEEDLAFIRGMRHFIAYIQERQDYIATIAASDPLTFNTLNFKDEVYDTLCPDLKALRHDREMVDNLLLRYIVSSERFVRPLDGEVLSDNMPGIDIYFRGWDGREMEHADLEALRQWNVALPGGVIGRQAICSVFENVMRNTAKHDAGKIKGNLRLILDCYDASDISRASDAPGDGLSTLSLQQVLQRYYVALDPEELYYYVTLTIDVEQDDGTLMALRRALHEPFTQNHVPIERNKGIKEMRIATAWLRGEPDSTLTKDNRFIAETLPDHSWNAERLNNRPPLLYARLTDKKQLQYIFCLMKPKELALVVGDGKGEKPEFPPDWGWKAYTESEYMALRTNTYENVLVEDGADYGRVRSRSGCRCLRCSEVGTIDYGDRQGTLEAIARVVSGYEEGDTIAIGDGDGKKMAAHYAIAEGARGYIQLYQRRNEANYRYLYIGHYNGQQQFRSQYRSVEAITGGNSTDRLVRHPQRWDQLWFYRHLGALKSHIGLFDERLYGRLLDAAEKRPSGLGLDTLDKRINIYTLEQTPDKRFVVKTIVAKATGQEVRELEEVELMYLSWDKDNGLSSEAVHADQLVPADILSVHQGLFDKLYDLFRIREYRDRMKLFRQFYLMFSAKRQVLREDSIGGRETFCEGMIIHSGRAKPNAEAMPMHLPFIPFASVERALMDCKYTLYELFVNAKNTI